MTRRNFSRRNTSHAWRPFSVAREGGRRLAPYLVVMALTQKDLIWDYAPKEPATARTERKLRVVPVPEKPLFRSLEFMESRKNAVFMSIVAHAVILSILVAI